MVDLLETLRLAADDPMWANHVEMPKKLVRHTVDRIAELEAENARYAEELVGAAAREDILKSEIDQLRAESLSRTGAVKAGPLAHVIAEMLERAGEPRPNGDILHDILVQALPAALEPAAPEGQREARSGDAQDIANRLRSFFSEPGDARQLALDAAMMIEYLNKPALRPAEQAVTEAAAEVAAKTITKWLGISWDGLRDGRVVEKGFPVFLHHSQTVWQFQGHKGDMIDIARAVLTAALKGDRGWPER